MSTTKPAGTPGTRRASITARLAVVAVAMVATAAVWAIANMLDVELAAETATGTMDVTLASVIIVTLLVGLAGWGLLALLERGTARGRTIWTIAALVVLLVSLAGPLGGVTTGAKVALAGMHLAAAIVIIPGLRWSSPQR